jgi:hypothetical protein
MVAPARDGKNQSKTGGARNAFRFRLAYHTQRQKASVKSRRVCFEGQISSGLWANSLISTRLQPGVREVMSAKPLQRLMVGGNGLGLAALGRRLRFKPLKRLLVTSSSLHPAEAGC